MANVLKAPPAVIDTLAKTGARDQTVRNETSCECSMTYYNNAKVVINTARESGARDTRLKRQFELYDGWY